jgi:hypothetical protein
MFCFYIRYRRNVLLLSLIEKSLDYICKPGKTGPEGVVSDTSAANIDRV